MHHLITEIQSLGIHVHKEITGRQGGAGPAEGRAFLVNGIPVSVPISAGYVFDSPFSLEEMDLGYCLLKNGKPICPVSVVPEPGFYKKSMNDGTSYKQIAPPRNLSLIDEISAWTITKKHGKKQFNYLVTTK